jgi:hypothetical protein
VITLGEVYWWDGHPWIVISEPNHRSGKFLCVNLTTLDEDCPDDECILQKTDYAWIETNHLTAVAFSRAKILETRQFNEAVNRGKLRAGFPPAISVECLKKIQEAARRSKQLGKDKRDLLPLT